MPSFSSLNLDGNPPVPPSSLPTNPWIPCFDDCDIKDDQCEVCYRCCFICIEHGGCICDIEDNQPNPDCSHCGQQLEFGLDLGNLSKWLFIEEKKYQFTFNPAPSSFFVMSGQMCPICEVSKYQFLFSPIKKNIFKHAERSRVVTVEAFPLFEILAALGNPTVDYFRWKSAIFATYVLSGIFATCVLSGIFATYVLSGIFTTYVLSGIFATYVLSGIFATYGDMWGQWLVGWVVCWLVQ